MRPAVFGLILAGYLVAVTGRIQYQCFFDRLRSLENGCRDGGVVRVTESRTVVPRLPNNSSVDSRNKPQFLSAHKYMMESGELIEYCKPGLPDLPFLNYGDFRATMYPNPCFECMCDGITGLSCCECDRGRNQG